MELLKIILMCVLAPLFIVLIVKIVLGAGKLIAVFMGAGHLARRFPGKGKAPESIRMAPFVMGLAGSSIGSLGSNREGLYIEFGLNMAPPIFIPWQAFTSVRRLPIGVWLMVDGVPLIVPKRVLKAREATPTPPSS